MQNQADSKELQQLGLTERESKVYVALVERGPILPLEIQAITSLQRSKIYEILHSLLQHGFVIERTVQKRKLYEAIRPDEVIQRLLLLRSQEIEQFQLIGLQLAQRLTALYNASFSGRSAQDYFTFLQDPTQICRHSDDLHCSAKKEVLSFIRAPYVYPSIGSDPELNIKEEIAALRRGVRQRAIYVADELLRREEWLHAELQPLFQAGEEARVHPDLPIKLCVFDHRVSLFGFVDETSPDRATAILIENRGIALAMAACFEHFWQASIPLTDFLKTRSAPGLAALFPDA